MGYSPVVAIGPAIPALLTEMCNAPYLATLSLTNRSLSAALLVSAWMKKASPPAA